MKLKSFLPILLMMVFAISCTKEKMQEKEVLCTGNYFVELSEVEEIARGIQFPNDGDVVLKSSGPLTKSVLSIEEVRNSNGLTSFYIINYESGGFVLLSADRRSIPILGFSKDNSFIVDEEIYTGGLGFWLNDAKEQIMKIQLSNSEQSPEAEILWDNVQQSIIDEVTSHKSVPPEDCYDHTEIYTCGPLGIPTWHQNAPYKGDLPYINCNGTQFQAKVGCMPLAMAAVMRYHEHPTSYNWSQMYYGYSTSTTEAFIADIHDEINSEYPALPVYTCTGTGVGGDMSWVLKNNFDYSNAILANYNYQTVVNNIAYDRPVILTGEDPTYGKHSWVCSGYRWYTYYNADCTATSSLHFYMYWGYENAANNGWYSEGNFNPGVYSYNNNKTMIYNIIP